MQYNKLRRIVLAAMTLSVSSSPVLAYTRDTITNNATTSAEVIIESNIKIKDNWLTREVARQSNKNVEQLTDEDFSNIKIVDLKGSSINSKIPEEIQLLKNLEYLNLNNSEINGRVPEYIGDLPKLTYLDLGNNNIERLPDNIKEKIIAGSYNYCDIEGNNFKLDEGWYFLKGKWCYLDRNGERIQGIQEIGQKAYDFDENGNIKAGWEYDQDKNSYYDGFNGMVTSNWKMIDGKWYYFDKDGIMQKGLQTIQDVKYYLSDTGVLLTGWQNIDNKWYYFGVSGGMTYGWLNRDNNWYYLDITTGAMATGDATIDDKKYRFSNNGSLMTNVWIDDYIYVQANGYPVNTYSDYSHSNTNYELFKYMTNLDNEDSVDSTAIQLHGGDTNNTCVYFLSEALRRVGINIPMGTANTYQLESQLENMGFSYSYDLSQLKPGDIVFTNNYTHVYIFMYWDTDGYAYVVDNQRTDFNNNVLHRRSILKDDGTIDRASHFFYYPN